MPVEGLDSILCENCANVNYKNLFSKCRRCGVIMVVQDKLWSRMEFVSENIAQGNASPSDLEWTGHGFIFSTDTCSSCNKQEEEDFKNADPRQSTTH